MQHAGFVNVLQTERQFAGNWDDELLWQTRSWVLECCHWFHQRSHTASTSVLADDPELVMHGLGFLDDVHIGPSFAVTELLQDIDLFQRLRQVLGGHLLVVDRVDVNDLDCDHVSSLAALAEQR